MVHKVLKSYYTCRTDACRLVFRCLTCIQFEELCEEDL